MAGRRRLGVTRGDELADGGFELGDAAVRAAAELLVREFSEPALDEVQPGAIGRRREVDVKAGPLREPVPIEKSIGRVGEGGASVRDRDASLALKRMDSPGTR